ncbi:MAG TPA: SpoIIE family protein phosphatase [Candidatus Acidoferrum sp.]|nr:SpoIIE family protein phosphatase [Candidatus Acidoferrum sp.]
MATMAFPLSADGIAAQPRVLIADDQTDVLEALRLLLKGHGYATEAVSSPAALLNIIKNTDFDAVLMDLNYARDTTSGREGLDLLAQLQGMTNIPPIIVMTGWATVGLAVEAMQRGVGDFVEKPWTNTRLLEILSKQIEIGRARRESREKEIQRERARSETVYRVEAQEREIDEALAIQKALLPSQIPQTPGYRISAVWQPFRKVGGDYYDLLDFSAGNLGICIADVAGKGVAAAMLMANLQSAVRGLAGANTPPEQLCNRLNELVRRNLTDDRFITLFYAHLDGPQHNLRYANAGHNAPILVHVDGSYERLEQGGGVLGAFESQNYRTGMQQLVPGDRLVFFTDGITEACAPEAGAPLSGAQRQSVSVDAEEFGESRLIELVVERRQEDAEELQRTILRTVGEYCRGNWTDDATLILLAVD